MDPRERKEILGEWGTRPENDRERVQREVLERDLEESPLRGKPLRRRLRNASPSIDGYVASLGGPLPYMVRLREIEAETAAHERRLRHAWQELAARSADSDDFARRWRRLAGRWSFVAVNELIDRHNRYYPVEARLPMDVRRRDFALVNGKPYRREPLDAAWALERFPPVLELAAGAIALR